MFGASGTSSTMFFVVVVFVLFFSNETPNELIHLAGQTYSRHLYNERTLQVMRNTEP